jgi:hypothetical protein
MKVAEVKGFYILNNFMHESKDMRIYMSFKDRLKFLIFGESTVIRFDNEKIIKNSTSKVFNRGYSEV